MIASMFPEPRQHVSHWESFVPGETTRLGQMTLDADGLSRFETAFTGAKPPRAASIMALSAGLMRLITDSHLAQAQGLGSPGIDDVSLRGAAQAGDTLTADMTPLMRRPLGSRPGVGLVILDYHVVQAATGTPVLTWRSRQFMAIAQPDAAVSSGTAPELPGLTITSTLIADADADANLIGHHKFSRDEILAFATDYDPQPFHLDDAAAKTSLFGALCASGWHTCAVALRMVRDHVVRTRAIAAYPNAPQGVLPIRSLRDIKWIQPVFVDDVINFTLRFAGASADCEGQACDVHIVDGHRHSGAPVFSATVWVPQG